MLDGKTAMSAFLCCNGVLPGKKYLYDKCNLHMKKGNMSKIQVKGEKYRKNSYCPIFLMQERKRPDYLKSRI